MSLSRTHIAFLAIISIFTGLVAPGTESGGVLLSYLMTDARWVVYLIFFGLVGAFLLASMRSWRYYRVVIFLIIIGVVALGILTYLSRIWSLKGGSPVDGFSWGWAFLIIGSILLYWSYYQRQSEEAETSFSDTIDTIIGMMGGFALACIGGIIALSSFSYFSRGDDHEILSRLAESGSISVLSGEVKAYGNYANMPSLDYKRSKDRLLTTVESASGRVWTLMQEESLRSGVLEKGTTPLVLGETIYSVDEKGYAYSGGHLILGSRVSKNDALLLYKSGGSLHVITDDAERTLDYKGIIGSHIKTSHDKSAIGWIEATGSLERLVISGKGQSGSYADIVDFSLSANGKNAILLIQTADTKDIVRNGVSIGQLPLSYITGSYISNGIHVAFLTSEGGGKRLYYNFEAIGNVLDEIREVFLEEDGTSYAYFGRPVGEEKWCLFTRYRGNICGLEGYMNPRLGADGGSIIFAGKKDGIWSIYRNTESIVKDTGYSAKDNSYDYAFYDPTKPQTYLFIEYDKEKKTYRYRKNGVRLPTEWQDVSTDVQFGYDNHILTSAKDRDGWKILEL